MKNQTALVSYVYPAVIKYFDELVECILEQSTNEFQTIIFNDGCKSSDLNIFENVGAIIINVNGSPNSIRFESFKILSTLKFNNIVFQDADDLMSTNRIKKTLEYFNRYLMVVNDLDLIDEKGRLLTKGFWSSRLKNEFKFEKEFLKNKNICGLGNTAIKRDLLDLPYKESNSVIAVDWYFFYQLLRLSNKKALFTNSSRTLYRQHDMNTIGLKNINEKRIKQAKNVKEIHYKELMKIGFDFELELLKLHKRKQINYQRINNNKNHFWWEETEYLK